MTEEQYEKARFIKSGIEKCEKALRNHIRGVCYEPKYIDNNTLINLTLGDEVNEKIKKIIEERLEQFKKEFEEL